MSLKSRKRAEKNRVKQSPSNPLFLQKQAIRTAMLEYLGAAALFFVFTIAVMIIVFLNEAASPKTWSTILAQLIVWVIFIYFLLSFIRCLSIYQQLSKIKFSTEQSVSVYCRKILFLLKPISKFSSVVLCVVLVDESGNKFYFVYPEKSAPSDFAKKSIKEKYSGSKIELICYQNTNIVKTLPS